MPLHQIAALFLAIYLALHVLNAWMAGPNRACHFLDLRSWVTYRWTGRFGITGFILICIHLWCWNLPSS